MKSQPCILVIDDSVDTLNLVRITLTRNMECEILTARTGRDGIAQALQHRPDLVLLDIGLPDTDGYKVFKVIKGQAGFKEVPIIFLSGNVGQQDILMGLKLGAVDYIAKPYYPRELLARVSTHLEIYRQKQVIEEHLQRNRELLQVLCHDMANQISGIAGSLYLSELDLANSGRHHRRMKHNVENMTQMIALVRNFRALDDGKVRIELAAVDLNQAVENALETLYPRLAEKDIIAKVRIPEGLSVLAEATSLSNSVISNLLTNAVKFSYSGSEVEILAECLEADRICLEIRDRGIGIPPSLIENLFSMNKTTSRPGTGDESGTGYGMPLVKKFITLYGGTIGVESVEKKPGVPDHGTCISLIFQRPVEESV